MSSNTGEAKASPQSAGAWLREARQKQGLHIGALAALLKVPQSKLEALEGDRWSELTDMTFVRALAKAHCRALKLDPTPVLAMLPRGGEKELDVSLGINTPFREYGSRNDASALNIIQRKAVWGPLLLLAAAAGIWFLPSGLLNGPARPEQAASAAQATTVAELPASEPQAQQPVSQAAPMVEAPTLASSAAVLAPVPTPVAASSTPTPTATRVATAPAPAASPAAVPSTAGQVPLAIRLSADSWIRVTDGNGQVLLSKLLKVGEDQQLAGTPPLKVTVGNVAGTQLLLRGSPVELVSRNKDNVAVLELN